MSADPSRGARRYDPTWRALLFPSAADDFFAGGRPQSELALCSELSRVAYIGFERNEAGRERASEILRRAGFTREEFISDGGTECFVARDVDAKLTVVAFRGTAGVLDVLTDAMAWRVGWAPGGKVHSGFSRALRRIWPRLVLSLDRGRERLLYTGHSLGGALATLAATLVQPDALYTFGAPRVGDRAFTALLDDVPTYRITDCADLICGVPPAWLGYEHAGSMTYVDRYGRTHADPPRELIAGDTRLARREYRHEYGWRLGNVWTRRLADHAPVNYVSALCSTETPQADATAAAGRR